MAGIFLFPLNTVQLVLDQAFSLMLVSEQGASAVSKQRWLLLLFH